MTKKIKIKFQKEILKRKKKEKSKKSKNNNNKKNAKFKIQNLKFIYELPKNPKPEISFRDYFQKN